MFIIFLFRKLYRIININGDRDCIILPCIAALVKRLVVIITFTAVMARAFRGQNAFFGERVENVRFFTHTTGITYSRCRLRWIVHVLLKQILVSGTRRFYDFSLWAKRRACYYWLYYDLCFFIFLGGGERYTNNRKSLEFLQNINISPFQRAYDFLNILTIFELFISRPVMLEIFKKK